eukprot:CAMPEP_0176039152 /NCGR_PEP_ID=MMETSP0120_2-20121206/19407_1 /TAXON_ID=160619 /ORGANISM="Kryptoperidinium foliaceum, Strain CCMP 1326" /LENGTH=1114 /DNA_ID=CAMNT_0017372547 /DNA_START=67 /DNA_END=3411 /DNA_ORIENTATION=-
MSVDEEEVAEPVSEDAVEQREDGEDNVEDSSRALVADGMYSAEDVNDRVFDELQLHPAAARDTQQVWAAYLKAAESPEAAGEAIYAAIYEAAPGLQALFKTSRPILAARLLRAIGAIVGHLHEPKDLKMTAEALGFQHLDHDVTVPRVALLRDAIVDVIATELGASRSDTALLGFKVALNYVGGALIYVRVRYAARLKILASSWTMANKKPEQRDGTGEDDEDDEGDGSAGAPFVKEDRARTPKQRQADKTMGGVGLKAKKLLGTDGEEKEARRDDKNITIPRTFPEMFRFNAAVMGFGELAWMQEVLSSFDAIVCNISSSYRLQEECDVLALRLSKHPGPIDLADFKAVMFASLRSLVPKGWDSEHEVAWSWLWKNVERLLVEQMGKLAKQERACARLFAGIEHEDRTPLHKQVYTSFFEIAPTGQDYFKQSTTRLHFVAEKVAMLAADMYKDPDGVVNELSACGLRHVGYGIPQELCGPLAGAYAVALRNFVDDPEGVDAFDWSLNLVSRIIARVINEGSTLVMKAINQNNGKQLAKAVACAPRRDRANWVLRVTVGSQSISPLMWAIETGSLDAAGAIIQDLLTIRADRDRYYYGVDALFGRHPDILRRLCMDAPGLLPALLDGLIWRSRLTESGRRRVVYFAKHLIVNQDGEFARAIEWIVQKRDPKVVCHPVVSYVIDLVWMKLAATAFLYKKTWLLLTATVFTMSQAVLNHGIHEEVTGNLGVRSTILGMRGFIYMVSWPSLAMVHIKRGRQDIRSNNFVKLFWFKVPAHLVEFNSVASLLLCIILMVMLALCPILQCLGSVSTNGQHLLFTERCEKGDKTLEIYSIFSMFGMLCYWVLLADLSVFSNRVCAFLLIFGHVLSEVGLFLLSMVFFVLIFSTAAAALKEEEGDFDSIEAAGRTLLQMFLGMASSEQYSHLDHHPMLFALVVSYCFVTGVYMVNLLIAQLSCAYKATFQDMVGFALLKRAAVCVSVMTAVPARRWQRFVESLRMDEPCEFGEGDIGMPGAIQVTEPANANVTTYDMIRRFGGTTSGAAPWPDDDVSAQTDAEDKINRLERALKVIMRKVADGSVGKRRDGSSAGRSSILSSNLAHTHNSSSNSSERSGREE